MNTTRTLIAPGSYIDDKSTSPRDVQSALMVKGGVRPPAYVTGNRYGAPQGATTSTVATANGVMDFTLFYLGDIATFTGIASFPTIAITIAAHFGIYADASTAAGYQPGALIPGSDVTIATLTAAAENVASFTSAITLTPGFYWIAKLGNGTATFTASGASNGLHNMGMPALLTSGTNTGVKVTATQAYGALPAVCPAATTTYTSTNAMIQLALIAQ